MSPPTDAPEVRRPWLPGCLAAHGLTTRTVQVLAYVVVDEIVDDEIVLAVSPWPVADGHGRLRFRGDGPAFNVAASIHDLVDHLYDGWLERAPRVGDVFAAAVTVPAGIGPVDDEIVWDRPLGDLLHVPVYDITAEARKVAKLAYYGAVGTPIAGEEAREWDLLELADTDASAAPVREQPLPTSGRPATVPEPTVAAEDRPWDVPDALVGAGPGGFVEAALEEPDALLYLVLNVGDADAQVLLLPADRAGIRRVVIVDCGLNRKMPGLLGSLAEAEVLPALDTDRLIALVVATHPHHDHLGGIPELLERHGAVVDELWEPGFYHPGSAFVELMVGLEDRPWIRHVQPTSGLAAHLGTVRITVLAPSTTLRSRFDSYGVDVNDASIALRVDFPAVRVARQPAEDGPHEDRVYLRTPEPWSLILGADAQATSWAQAQIDFPELHREHNPALYRELRMTLGTDGLRAHILKVPHHASKHGLNLELAERMNPLVSLVSSVGGGGRYNFPHRVALDSLREALQPTTSSGAAREPDHALGIHYTGGRVREDDAWRSAGTIAMLIPPKRGRDLRMWRFGDDPRDAVDLSAARELTAVRGAVSP